MPELVALDLDGGAEFVDALRRVWDAGDAVLPLERRAPAAHRDAQVAALRPGAVIGADGERHRLEGGQPVEPGDAVVVATSGTTGAPKGVVLTHDAVRRAGELTAGAVQGGAGAGWLACLPLSHVGGLSVVTRALVAGAELEVHPRADPAAIDDAARRGLTHVSLVPALLPRVEVARWRVVLLGGSAIPADRPSNAVATYGMTETFGGVVYDGVPLPGVEVRITAAAGVVAAPGTTGTIELRAPTLLRCYRRPGDPDTGVGPLDDDGWFRTGDLGWLEARDGRLVVAGRADDLIITGGEKVWPGPVEEVLRQVPGVADVAVVGRPDPEWGQRVVAVVEPGGGGDPPTLQALRDAAREHLPIAAAPKELVLLDSLPRTGIGKIARHALSGDDERGGRGGSDR